MTTNWFAKLWQRPKCWQGHHRWKVHYDKVLYYDWVIGYPPQYRRVEEVECLACGYRTQKMREQVPTPPNPELIPNG